MSKIMSQAIGMSLVRGVAICLGCLIISGCSNEKGLDRTYRLDNEAFKKIANIPDEVSGEELEMFRTYFGGEFMQSLTDFQIRGSRKRHEQMEGKTVRQIMLMNIAEQEAELNSKMETHKNLQNLTADITAVNTEPGFYEGVADTCKATIQVKNNSPYQIQGFVVRGHGAIDGFNSRIIFPNLVQIDKALVSETRMLEPNGSIELTESCTLHNATGEDLSVVKESPTFNLTSNLHLISIRIQGQRDSISDVSSKTIDGFVKQLEKLAADKAALTIK